MNVVAGLLAIGIVCIYFHAQIQQGRMLAAFEKERAKLLDRIQFPEVRQVQAVDPVEHIPPKDAGELAWVGEIVPEFINVGNSQENHDGP